MGEGGGGVWVERAHMVMSRVSVSLTSSPPSVDMYISLSLSLCDTHHDTTPHAIISYALTYTR